MKFGILSDLHLEFQSWFYDPDPEVFYINAGDTSPSRVMRDLSYIFNKDRYFAILGNHDYYQGQAVSNEIFQIYQGNNFKIAGTTLWTYMKSPVEFEFYRRYMIDSRYIPWTYQSYITAFEVQREFLFDSQADIIVSHHAPSYQSLHWKFKNDPGNQFFMSDLDYMIMTMKKPPKLWCFGHIHNPCMYWIGETLFVCNPRGYPGEVNHKNYLPIILDEDNWPSKFEGVKWLR